MPQQQEPVVVNLRQVRKRKARTDKDAVAAQNRILHGRTKGTKMRDRLAAESAKTLHEGNFRRREADESGKRG